MKIVIFAALVVASMGACPAAFTDAMITTGYAYGVKSTAQATCVPADSKYTAAKDTMNTKADIGNPTADGAAAGIECASGYTKATAGIKFGAADKDCALTGCTVTATAAPKKMCDAKTNAAVTDKYAAFDAPKCESGRSTKTTKCTKAKNTGWFSWSCSDGTWSETAGSGCNAAAWSTPNKLGCAVAKKGAVTEGAKVEATCSTGTAADCTATKPDPVTCPKSTTDDDPKCLAAAVKVLNDAKSTCSKEQDTAAGGTIAGVGASTGVTYTCTLVNKASADGVDAKFVPSAGTSGKALTCGETAGGGGGDGSSAGTLSTFVALVAAVAYMW